MYAVKYKISILFGVYLFSYLWIKGFETCHYHKKVSTLLQKDIQIIDSVEINHPEVFQNILYMHSGKVYNIGKFSVSIHDTKGKSEIFYKGQTTECLTGKESMKKKIPIRLYAFGISPYDNFWVIDDIGQKLYEYHNNTVKNRLYLNMLKKDNEIKINNPPYFHFLSDSIAIIPYISYDFYRGKASLNKNTQLFNLVNVYTGNTLLKFGTWDSIYTNNDIHKELVKYTGIYFVPNVLISKNELAYTTELGNTIKIHNITDNKSYSLPKPNNFISMNWSSINKKDTIIFSTNFTLFYDKNTNQLLQQYRTHKQVMDKTIAMEDYLVIYSIEQKSIVSEIKIQKPLRYLVGVDKNTLWFDNHKTSNDTKIVLYKVQLVPDN